MILISRKYYDILWGRNMWLEKVRDEAKNDTERYYRACMLLKEVRSRILSLHYALNYSECYPS